MADVATADVAAEVSTTIRAFRNEVWDCLVDLDNISKFFFAAHVATDWVVGHPITWSGEWQGKAYEDKGEITRFEPDRAFGFAMRDPKAFDFEIDLELSPTAGGTRRSATTASPDCPTTSISVTSPCWRTARF